MYQKEIRQIIRFYLGIALIAGLFFGGAFLLQAGDTIDDDQDGISNYHELHKYYTDDQNPDTDGDGYDDGTEIRNWYSPLNAEPIKYSQLDSDSDGLNDEMELRFRTSMIQADTDGDGYDDKTEIDNYYDPKDPAKKLLPKHIEISIKDQKLHYFLDNVEMGGYTVSTGAHDSTPRGEFAVNSKFERAWSRSAKLWMPYWMAFDRHLYGIHELPEWPNGVKEGQDHLGQPVSGGCVRLGVGEAEELYKWTPVGTKIIIK